MIFNAASKVVMWGFLASILIVTVTGYLLPWSLGRPLDMFGILAIPSPIAGSPGFHELIERTHNAAGHILPYLILLHVLGAAKHLMIDREGVFMRMIRPVGGGR